MPITPKELDKIIAQAEKKKLGLVIHRGDEVERTYRIPMKSPNMNYATEGGLPIGRFSLMWGDESSYKTRTAYEAISQAQNLYKASEVSLYPRIKFYRDMGDTKREKRLVEELEYIQGTWPDGMEVAFYNAEQQYDKVWARRLGIDTHRLILVEGQTIESIVELMEGTYSTIDMHVVDSTSNCVSIQELNAKKTDSLYAADARAWKRCIRSSMPHFDPHRNVGLLINQASTNINRGGATPVSTRHMRHTSGMTLKFQRGRFLYEKDGFLQDDKVEGADKASLAGMVEPGGVEIFAKVEKSRVCRPFRIAALHAQFGAKQFDHIWELFNAGVHYGVIIKSGSWYRVDGDAEGVKPMQGEKKVRDRLKEDEELRGRVYATLMHAIEYEDGIDDPETADDVALDDDLDDEEQAEAA